jgi:hypothetical protein
MTVYLDNLFDRGGLEEGGGDALFDAENNTFRCGDLYSALDGKGEEHGGSNNVHR